MNAEQRAARDLEIAELYTAGATYNEIAEHLGLTSSGVWRALNRQGAIDQRRDERRKRDAEILDMWADGLTQTAISHRVGLTQPAVSCILIAHGAPPAPDRLAERDAQILALWDDGLTRAQISARVGLSESAVYTAIKRRGGHSRRTARNADAQSSRDEALTRLWCEGDLTAAQIADEVGMTTGSVYNRAASLGLPRRPRGRKAKP